MSRCTTTPSRLADKHKSTGFGETEYAEILQATLEMDGLIKTHTAIMDKYDPQKKLALVVDEWGAWYAPLPGSNPGFLVQQNSLRDAMLAALNLNIFARHADRVRMANIAQMVNVLQAMILTDKEKMLLTPTYHVFRMYVPFQDATLRAGERRCRQLDSRQRHPAASRCDRRQGRAGQAVAGRDQPGPTRPATIEVNLADATPADGHGRNAHRAAGRQRQHLRVTQRRRAQADHGDGPRRHRLR